MSKQVTIGRRGVIAAAAGAVAGVLVRPDAPPAAASSGLGDQGNFVLGANPVFKASGGTNTPNISSVTTTLQASPNFSVHTTDTTSSVLQIDARPAGTSSIGAIEAWGAGDAAAVVATGSATSKSSHGLDATASGTAVSAIGGSTGVFAASNGPVLSAGIIAVSVNGYGGIFQGGAAPIVMASATTAGPPTGQHGVGELFVDSDGALFYSTASGTPATWVNLSVAATAPVFHMLPTPERFVDTRSGLGGVQGPVSAGTTRSFQMSGRVGQTGDVTLQVPDNATTIVGNLTVIGGPTIGVGSFVTLWPGGPLPAVSNINVGPGGVVANSFVVGTLAAAGHRTLNVFNFQLCDYILDVTGYYT